MTDTNADWLLKIGSEIARVKAHDDALLSHIAWALAIIGAGVVALLSALAEVPELDKWKIAAIAWSSLAIYQLLIIPFLALIVITRSTTNITRVLGPYHPPTVAYSTRGALAILGLVLLWAPLPLLERATVGFFGGIHAFHFFATDLSLRPDYRKRLRESAEERASLRHRLAQAGFYGVPALHVAAILFLAGWTFLRMDFSQPGWGYGLTSAGIGAVLLLFLQFLVSAMNEYDRGLQDALIELRTAIACGIVTEDSIDDAFRDLYSVPEICEQLQSAYSKYATKPAATVFDAAYA